MKIIKGPFHMGKIMSNEDKEKLKEVICQGGKDNES